MLRDTRGLNPWFWTSVPLCKESDSRLQHTSVATPCRVDEWSVDVTEIASELRLLIDITQRNCAAASPYLAQA